jgi:hypothetical protein
MSAQSDTFRGGWPAVKSDSVSVAKRKPTPRIEPRNRKSIAASANAPVNGKPFAASFAQLIFESRLAGSADAARFEVSRPLLIELLRPMFHALRFDPGWYQSAYPDIAVAHRAGTLSDLKAHYCEFGFFEHRLPCLVRVDESFYPSEYPDIGTAIAEGRIASAQWHFETFGFREGRLPWRGWRFADLLEGG